MSENEPTPTEANTTSEAEHTPEEAQDKNQNVPFGAIFVTTFLSLLILTAWFAMYALNFARS